MYIYIYVAGNTKEFVAMVLQQLRADWSTTYVHTCTCGSYTTNIATLHVPYNMNTMNSSHIPACMGKCTGKRPCGFYTIQITKEGVVAHGVTMSRSVNMRIYSSKTLLNTFALEIPSLKTEVCLQTAYCLSQGACMHSLDFIVMDKFVYIKQ